MSDTLDKMLAEARARGLNFSDGSYGYSLMKLSADAIDNMRRELESRAVVILGKEEREEMKFENRLNCATTKELDDVVAEVGLSRLYEESDSFLRERARAAWRRELGGTEPLQYNDPRRAVTEESYPTCNKATHNFDVATLRCTHCDAYLRWFIRDGQHVADASLETLLHMKREADKHMEAGWMRVLGFAIERQRNIERERAGKLAANYPMPVVEFKLKAPPCEHRFCDIGNPPRCSACRIVLTPCKFKGCKAPIAKLMPHETHPPQTSEQWTRAAEVLCTRHVIAKLQQESGPGMSPEGATDAGKLVAEPSTCDVGADWEDL